MSVSRLHNLYAVSLFPDALVSEVVLDGVLRQSVESGLETRGQPTSGSAVVRFLSIVNGDPMVRLGTCKLAQALDTIGLYGLKIASATNPGVKLFAYAHDEGGTRKTGGAHRQYLIKKGLIIPRTLSVEGQGDAELDYEILVVKDGVNDPIVESDLVAVPALSGDDEHYGIGPIALGGVALPQIRRVELDFGITARTQKTDGEVFPSWVSIQSVAPRLTLRGVDVEWLKSTNLPRNGKALVHADSEVNFRKRDLNGQYVADASAVHIQATVCGLATVQTLFDAEGDAEGECTVQIDTRHDGTNNPLVIDTTAAI